MAREQGTGKSQEVLDDFTFLYTDWFYYVHLLTYPCLESNFVPLRFGGK